jgi:hypothetical protein
METATAATPFNFGQIKDRVIAVITKPGEFYRSMPKLGGFVEPMIFLTCMGLVAGIINAIGIIGATLPGAIMAIILAPIFAVIFSFVGALIVFVIWKMMGSRENYETAYRCVAFAAAVAPITSLTGYIPYLGGLISAAWGFVLMYNASVEVHQIAKARAKLVWGILFGLLAVMGLSSEVASRRIASNFENFQSQVESGEMTPEQAGRMLGEFMKGMQEGAKKPQE